MLKNYTFIVSFVLIGFLFPNRTFSQNIDHSERNYHLNVKQFNEFVDRFNYKTDFKGNPIDSSFSLTFKRADYISLLFNNEDPRNIKKDSDYLNLINDFKQTVASNNLLINKYSLKIIAETKSLVVYKNQTHEIRIFLNQEIQNNGVKWVLLSVKADFLDVLKEDTSLVRFIPPTSNETNFISLKAALEDKNYQQYYAYSDYKYNQLSSFLFALNTEQIKFQYVNDLIYHIFDIDGWYIRVREFNRSTENSGWLIEDISKTNLDFNNNLSKLLFD